MDWNGILQGLDKGQKGTIGILERERAPTKLWPLKSAVLRPREQEISPTYCSRQLKMEWGVDKKHPREYESWMGRLRRRLHHPKSGTSGIPRVPARVQSALKSTP